MEPVNAIELLGVTKRFGEVVANDNVNLTVRKGEILSILGENGSGKTTLMNMLSGIYFPDEGEIRVNGKTVTIRSPKDSFELGIGMIHQHFKLINILTAAENIILGLPGKERLNLKQVEKEVKELTDRYGFDLNPSQKIYDMSVSQKQTVEIVKVLYRGADILILDEPTAVLTPQETEKLFAVLRNMRAAGKSIIIITHKLNEVLELSDRVAVLRKGKYIDTVETKGATVESLTEMMVGEKVTLDINRTEPENAKKRIEMRGVTCRNKEGLKVLKEASFTAYSGEILGIAGISGSGQKELCECIDGIREVTSGKIKYYAEEGNFDITNKKPEWRRKNKTGFGFVPEDRLGMGLIASSDMVDNMVLKSYKDEAGAFLHRKKAADIAKYLIKKLDIATPGIHTPVRMLSGGNVQKVLLGREIEAGRDVLIVSYPVRGLDINSSYMIYNLLDEERKRGTAIIFVGEDLDVLMALSDRIMVMADHRIAGITDARTVTKDYLGSLMTDTKGQVI